MDDTPHMTITIHYLQYAHGVQWPSDSNRNAVGLPVLEDIDEMPPQKAAACLAKLCRWAAAGGTGDMMHLDVDGRDDYIRSTRMARALAARALGLHAIEDVYALYSDVNDVLKPPIGIKELLGEIFSSLVETHPLANAADLGTVAAVISGHLLTKYDVISRD